MDSRHVNNRQGMDLRNIKDSQLTGLSPTGMLVKKKQRLSMNPRFSIFTREKSINAGLFSQVLSL